jgi:hypothetical protein
VIHTYQDADVLRSRFWDHPVVDLLSFGVISLFVVGLFAFTGGSFTLQAAGPLFGGLGLLFAAAYAGQRHLQSATCGEIRLDDDGTCELQTKRRVIRLHVSEIRCVKYRRDPEGGSASFTVYHPSGTLLVTEEMTGFLDFLTRLATLNPAVDLSSFPAFLADGWSRSGTPATAVSGTDVGRLVRSVVFPLCVVVLLVWLALETLLGQLRPAWEP